MADKRMFTKKITESDAFLDMPLSAQCLYFHLNMSADDDGFVNAPKKIQRLIGAKDDDLKILIMKSFLLVFEHGVVVIKHWRMHNTIRQDRYHPTDYQDEFKSLGLKDNGSYTQNNNGNQMATKCIPFGNSDIDLDIDLDLDKGLVNKYIVEILDHLNTRIGSHYKPTTKKTRELIKARLKEKFTVEDFKVVIDKMCVEWMNTNYQIYLRPETLFGTKFESYLNREVKQTTKNITLSDEKIKELFG